MLVVMDADLMHGWSQRGFLSAAAALRLPGAAVQDSTERASAGWDVVCANGVRDRAGNTRDAFAWRSNEQPFSEAQYVAAQMQAGTGVAAAREAYWDNVLPKLQVPHSCWDPQKWLSGLLHCGGASTSSSARQQIIYLDWCK